MNYKGDWWVRAQALFGPGHAIHESRVDSETGIFVLYAQGAVRHLIVAGRADRPLKTFTLDLDYWKTGKDTGLYDMRGSCPEGSTE
jgi:hypothetical protein